MAKQRIEDLDIAETLGDSFGQYSKHVILNRAIPDVRDGLKPSQRRILYGMYTGGYTYNKATRKSAKIVGDVMGNYAPTGDSSIYQAMVRMGQDWKNGIPLVEIQGNKGNIDGDGPAAMRYCITGDSLVSMADGTLKKMEDFVPNSKLNTTYDIDEMVLDWNNEPVHASKFFNSGKHPIIKVVLENGTTIRGSYNHPLLVLKRSEDGVPVKCWKTLSEIVDSDIIIGMASYNENLCKEDSNIAMFLGGIVAEGSFSESRLTFNNTDELMFNQVVEFLNDNNLKYYHYTRKLNSGKLIHELDIQNKQTLSKLMSIIGTDLVGKKAKDKIIPKIILEGGYLFHRGFINTLFEGDGSVSLLHRTKNSSSIEISYSSRSEILINQLQVLLSTYGILSKKIQYSTGEFKLKIVGYYNIQKFKNLFGFSAVKKEKLNNYMSEVSGTKSVSKLDTIPYLTNYLRNYIKGKKISKPLRYIINKNNFSTLQNKYKYPELVDFIFNECPEISWMLSDYSFMKVKEIQHLPEEVVYSIKVDSDDHSFIANGLINHNTEARLNEFSENLVEGLKKDGVVPWAPNYDDSLMEPKVLPANYPNILVNGAKGLASGYNTDLLPHNFTEVMEACIAVLKDEAITMDELLKIIPAPDFPTGGTIIKGKDLKKMYLSGEGGIKTRSSYKVETKGNKMYIIFTDIPFGVKKGELMKKLTEIVVAKHVVGIQDITDESDRHGIRIVVQCAKDTDANVVLGYLYKKTDLMRNIPMKNVVIAKRKPKQLSLKQIILYFNQFRIETVRKIYEADKATLEHELHILEGFLKFANDLDKFIKIIRASSGRQDAVEKLVAEDFSKEQAEAIVVIQVYRLAKVSFDDYQAKYDEKTKTLNAINKVLSSEVMIKKAVLKGYRDLIKKYGTERKTTVKMEDESWEVTKVDIIKDEDVMVSVTRDGYIKRSTVRSYSSTITEDDKGFDVLADDEIVFSGRGNTKGGLLIFTNKLKYLYIPIHVIEEAKWKDLGKNIAVLGADLDSGEQVLQAFTVSDENRDNTILIAKSDGNVRRTPVNKFIRTQQFYKAVELGGGSDGISALGVWEIPKDADGYIGFKDSIGRTMYFVTDDITISTGIKAKGMRGISLNKGDTAVSAGFNLYEYPIYEEYAFLKEKARKGFKFKPLDKRDAEEIAEKRVKWDEYLESLQPKEAVEEPTSEEVDTDDDLTEELVEAKVASEPLF